VPPTVVALPDPVQLAAVLKAARENGVTHLRVGTFECDMAPLGVVEAINRVAPLPADPFDTIRQAAAGGIGAADAARARQAQALAGGESRPDILQALADGARLVNTGDPTQA